MAQSTESRLNTDNSEKSAPDGTIREFYIFGHNISHSLSPALHNAGFAEVGFLGRYAIHESPSIDESVKEILAKPAFGGASVTFPHKLQVGHLLDEITPAASTVGAVNTVLVREETPGCSRKLVGDNTDWAGIRTCILSAPCAADIGHSPAVVWGAGGAARAACYALQTLGVSEILIANRTRASAEQVARQFPDIAFRVFPTLREAAAELATATSKSNNDDNRPLPARIVVSCVPADDVTEEDVPASLFSGAGILVETAYRPPVTATMRVAARHPAWTMFGGTDVLKEQAFAQFELWTGRAAPRGVMAAAIKTEKRRREEESRGLGSKEGGGGGGSNDD